MLFFFSPPEGKKKQKNGLLPTSLGHAPSNLYVITDKKKNYTPLDSVSKLFAVHIFLKKHSLVK